MKRLRWLLLCRLFFGRHDLESIWRPGPGSNASEMFACMRCGWVGYRL